jgi:hypothetical protein
MNKHKNPIGVTLLLLGLGCFLQGPYLPGLALAAGSAAISEAALTKDISQLEHRFFAREYVHDPVEKRLERLELMVFGATQDGDSGDRFAHLKKAIGARSAQAQAQIPKTAAGAKQAAPLTSQQYPVLKTLEWRTFKKTFPNDTLPDRLSRLEKKVFGADNTAMSYADRVDRLRKTLGIDSIAQQPAQPQGQIIGPAPKARGRGQMNPDIWNFSSPPMIGSRNFFGEDEDEGEDGMPSPGMRPGMGMGFGFGGLGLNSTMNNMMREMDRQMSQLQQLPSGAYSFDPNSGEWVDQFTGKRIKPPGGGASLQPRKPEQKPSAQSITPTPFKAPRIAPPLQPHNFGEMPPYSDPNSI